MLNILVVREMRAPDLVTPDEGVSSTLARGECRVALDPVTAGKLARHLDSSVSKTHGLELQNVDQLRNRTFQIVVLEHG